MLKFKNKFIEKSAVIIAFIKQNIGTRSSIIKLHAYRSEQDSDVGV